MDIRNVAIGFLLVLGILILVHEWGHFIVARLFGVRVDVFSIGFGPRLFGWKRGATDYRVSAIPLGGYVRMAGQDLSDIDAGWQKPTGPLSAVPKGTSLLIERGFAAMTSYCRSMPSLSTTGRKWWPPFKVPVANRCRQLCGARLRRSRSRSRRSPTRTTKANRSGSSASGQDRSTLSAESGSPGP